MTNKKLHVAKLQLAFDAINFERYLGKVMRCVKFVRYVQLEWHNALRKGLLHFMR